MTCPYVANFSNGFKPCISGQRVSLCNLDVQSEVDNLFITLKFLFCVSGIRLRKIGKHPIVTFGQHMLMSKLRCKNVASQFSIVIDPLPS